MAKKKFRGPEIVKEIEEAMDKGLATVLDQHPIQAVGVLANPDGSFGVKLVYR